MGLRRLYYAANSGVRRLTWGSRGANSGIHGPTCAGTGIRGLTWPGRTSFGRRLTCPACASTGIHGLTRRGRTSTGIRDLTCAGRINSAIRTLIGLLPTDSAIRRLVMFVGHYGKIISFFTPPDLSVTEILAF